MDELLSILTRERHALEALLFRLVEARGLLVTGETRFLSWAAADLDLAASAVRDLEANRARVAAGPATLGELVAIASEPHASMLDDHRVALARLAGELGAAIDAVQQISHDRLDRLVTVGAGCGGHLSRVASRDTPRAAMQDGRMDDLDHAIVAAGYEALLSATDTLRLPSLAGFLG